MTKLIKELNRRNVFKAAISYIVISWALLQAAGLLLPLFGFSNAAVRVIFYILLAIFPMWIIFAYLFEWTPEGLKRTVHVASGESVSRKTSVKLNTLIMGGMIMAIIFLLVDRFVNFSGTAGLRATDKERSVAVLPFDNMSGTEDAYFAAGVAEDILTQIAKIGDLRVLSPFTLKSYQAEGKTVEQIGKELGVEYLLMGSIRRAGEALRITCRLVQVNPEEQAWADNYDRNMEDVFAIQSQVAEEVARNLRANLSKDEKERVDLQPTENMAAYNIYLKGREAIGRYDSESSKLAIELFEQAIAFDPNFGLAYAGLASAWMQAEEYGVLPNQYLDSAAVAAAKAIQLAPEAGESWKAMGLFQLRKGNMGAAVGKYRKALELNPNDFVAIANLAVIQTEKGHRDEAVILMEKAVSLNPLSFAAYGNLISYYYWLGMYGHAEEALQKALAINDNYFSVLLQAINLYLATDETEKARHYLDRLLALGKNEKRVYSYAIRVALQLSDTALAKQCIAQTLEQEGFEPNGSPVPGMLGYLLWQEGKVDSAKTWLDAELAYLQQALQEDQKNQNYLYLTFVNHAIRGNKEEAIRYLERLFGTGYGFGYAIDHFTEDPRLSGLSNEPPFQTLMQRFEKKVEAQRLNVLAHERAQKLKGALNR